MKKLKFWLFLVGISLVIPVIGIGVSTAMTQGYQKLYTSVLNDRLPGIEEINSSEIPSTLKLEAFCKAKDLSIETQNFCNEYTQVSYLGYASIVVFAYSSLILILIPLLGAISSKNREILFVLFKPGLFFSQINAAILVAANSGILIASIFYAEPYFVGRLHYGIILSAGIAAFLGVCNVFIHAFSPIKSAKARVFGKILPKDSYPQIWNYVETLANKIGTTPPDTIIVGLEPTFFVTQSDVTCLDGEITGKSLFLSLPFCRVLSKDELGAIIGHELGHFVGEDTKWSQKFYPIYRGSTDTLSSLYEHGGESFAFLPAIYFMTLFIYSFEKSEKTIGRERELNADSIGSKISSSEIMSKALVKAHVFQHAWEYTNEKVKESLSDGKQIINISAYFHAVCSNTPADFMKDEIGKSSTSHPTDSHPPLLVRLNSMSIKLESIYADCLQLPTANTAIDLINDATNLEEELSDIEHYKIVKSGAVQMKNEIASENNNQDENSVQTQP